MSRRNLVTPLFFLAVYCIFPSSAAAQSTAQMVWGPNCNEDCVRIFNPYESTDWGWACITTGVGEGEGVGCEAGTDNCEMAHSCFPWLMGYAAINPELGSVMLAWAPKCDADFAPDRLARRTLDPASAPTSDQHVREVVGGMTIAQAWVSSSVE